MILPVDVETKLYFEAHITLDPVLEPERLQFLKDIAAKWDFRIADLIMVKGEPNLKDAFCSARSRSWYGIKSMTKHMAKELKQNGFKVRRYKIENTLIDSRQEVCGDILDLLGDQ